MKCYQKSADLETLAKMAARLAGRDPDEHLKMVLADVVCSNGPMWNYHDFLARAVSAYHVLTTPCLTVPPWPEGRDLAAGGSDPRWSDSGVQVVAL